jgi:pectate lyase
VNARQPCNPTLQAAIQVFSWWLLLLGLLPVQAQLPAFPGAEGQGATAAGGRGGDVYYVTNLNDNGPGSLREAITSATNSRSILFSVSGNIRLLSTLALEKPRLTIAGQTAPGDGICLQDYLLYVAADDVVVRHIRARLGTNALQDADAIWIAGGSRIILDHCSASWSTDETLSATRTARNVTVQWCYITESLNNALPGKGSHGYASLLTPGVNTTYSLHHNLYAHHRSRSPRPGSEAGKNLRLDFRNNVVYNWGNRAGYSGSTDAFVEMNYVGNYLIKGPSSSYDYAFQGGGITTKIFQSGNRLDLVRNKLFDGVDSGWAMFSESYTPAATAFSVAGVTTEAATVALQRVLAQAGALPWRRDAADVRVTSNVRNGTGLIIDRTLQVGGWPTLQAVTPPRDTDQDGLPDYWEQAVGLNPLNQDNNGDVNGDGYTNLEDYLNWLAGPHAVCNRDAPAAVNLRTLNGGTTNLTFTVANGLNGIVNLLADNHTVQFQPVTNFTGRASFTYMATDPTNNATFGPVTVQVLVVGSNTPPLLAAIADQVVLAGSTHTLTNLATDADQPPQTLRFALSNAPAGATINPVTGLFTWRPTMAQAGTTNAMAVVAWDDGGPNLSAAQPFTVVVNPPAAPVLQLLAFTNHQPVFLISGVAGPDYLVQASTNLVDWVTVFSTTPSALPFQWADSTAVSFGVRFYRIRLGP